MDLVDALRTTGAVRRFADAPVPDATLGAILDVARFAPSGGNRQPWHVIVCTDPATRARLGALYAARWREYVACALAGLVPFSPLATPEDRAAAAAQLDAAGARDEPDGLAATVRSAPCLLAVTVDLGALAALDRDLPRYQVVGGASVYPFCWQILLAAREHGLGGVITTVAVAAEPEVREALGFPATHALAALVALGQPLEPAPTRLRRRPVNAFTTIDRFDGPPLRP